MITQKRPNVNCFSVVLSLFLLIFVPLFKVGLILTCFRGQAGFGFSEAGWSSLLFRRLAPVPRAEVWGIFWGNGRAKTLPDSGQGGGWLDSGLIPVVEIGQSLFNPARQAGLEGSKTDVIVAFGKTAGLDKLAVLVQAP